MLTQFSQQLSQLIASSSLLLKRAFQLCLTVKEIEIKQPRMLKGELDAGPR